MVIYGVVTKGSADQPYWVKSYQLKFMAGKGPFRYVTYQEPYGQVKVGIQSRRFVGLYSVYPSLLVDYPFH